MTMMAIAKSRPRKVSATDRAKERENQTKAEYRTTMGWRIANAMRNHTPDPMSQSEVARRLGLTSHASIHNWVFNKVSPKREDVIRLAQILGVTDLYLEKGIEGPSDPMARLGVAIVPEVAFGNSSRDRTEVHKWGLPVTWLKEELQIVDTKLAMIYRVDNQQGKHEFGDRVLVDGSQRKPGPGEYLYWHANSPAIGTLSVPIAPQGRKAVVKVRAFAGMDEQVHEVEADKLEIIGRLKGTWRKA